MNDYERVAKVIRYLDRHAETQPGLKELAGLLQLSESHFHRLFRRWAGVTPKDFMQCLTAQFAKTRLRESGSIFEVSLEAGLSGPSRLHDLMVTLEAATPGEYKRRGAGLSIHWGLADSPFGLCSLGWNERGLCHLAFHDVAPAEIKAGDILAEWQEAKFLRDDREARRRAEQIFHPKVNRAPALSAFVMGTIFQVKVWRALLQIPPGCLASYARIANAIGQPGAARAVGNACHDNPIAYLIPCHRVIRETGIVEGYRWGTERKCALIAREACLAKN